MSEYVLAPSEELKHYGVLGMKWGVHKGNATKAYHKAVLKKKKLEKKRETAEIKSAKYQYLSDAENSKFLLRNPARARRYQTKASRYNLKSVGAKQRGIKWEKAMKEVFSNYDIKAVPGETVKVGRHQVEKYTLTPLVDLDK